MFRCATAATSCIKSRKSARPPASDVDDAALYALASGIDLNSFAVHAPGAEGAMGAACYLGGATLFNHSCDPNCRMRNELPTLTIAADRIAREASNRSLFGAMPACCPAEKA